MSATIEHITAREIKDSRGDPTLEVTIEAGGTLGTYAVPSGASTGAHEALELRDADKGTQGKGHMRSAIANIEKILAPALKGVKVEDQQKIDDILLELDGTKDKSHLGGNTMIGVSIACAKAAGGSGLVSHLRSLASMPPSRDEPLLFMNMINGGKHANTRLSFQEYQIIPQVDTVGESLRIGVAFYRALMQKMENEFGAGNVGMGDEGGVALDTLDVSLPLEIMTAVANDIKQSDAILCGLDVAADSLYVHGQYMVGEKTLSKEALLGVYDTLLSRYRLFSIEDPFFEEDFEGFASLLAAHNEIQVIGDDLTTTNETRLQTAIERSSITALIIKPNQIGTLTETLKTMKLARSHDLHCIVSHRSGETGDDFIADLAYAFGSFGLKSGAPHPKERMSKYKRLEYLTSHKSA